MDLGPPKPGEIKCHIVFDQKQYDNLRSRSHRLGVESSRTSKCPVTRLKHTTRGLESQQELRKTRKT